jgi:hypothetical protein
MPNTTMQNQVLADPCPGCNGLGCDPSNWDNFPPACGLCLGAKKLTRARYFELNRAEDWFLHHAPKREIAGLAEDLKRDFGYERPIV